MSFANDLQKANASMELFKHRIVEHIKGELVSIELEDEKIAKWFDIYSGIDALHKLGGQMRGVAIRCQWRNPTWRGTYPFDTFTIRYSRTTGTKTEYAYVVTGRRPVPLFRLWQQLEIVMQLYRFTNVHGRTRHGVCIETKDNGAYILSDTWQPTDKVTAPATFAYISFVPNPYVISTGMTKSELLPLETPVTWQTPEIAQIVAMMRAGTFADWWQDNQSVIVRKFINGYKAKDESK